MKRTLSIVLCLVLSLCLCGTVFADSPALLDENRGGLMTIELGRVYQGSRFYDIMGPTGGPEQYQIYFPSAGRAMITLIHNDEMSDSGGGDIMTGLNVTVRGTGVSLQKLAYRYVTLIDFDVSVGWYNIEVLANRFTTPDATYTIEVTYM